MNEDEFINFEDAIQIEEINGETIDEIAEAVAQEHHLNEPTTSSVAMQDDEHPIQDGETSDHEDDDLPFTSRFCITTAQDAHDASASHLRWCPIVLRRVLATFRCCLKCVKTLVRSSWRAAY